MRYKFFSNSEKTWQAMFEAIESANNSIYLEMYILENDIPRFSFLTLLAEKAKRGLRVRIILDAFGSVNLRKESIQKLKESGVELLFSSHFLHHIHRKILVIDENLAFIGGVNIHKVAKNWNDLSVRVRGKMVLSIIRSFAKVYADCGGKDPLILAQNKKIILDKMSTWLVEHFPLKNKLGFKKIYKEHFKKAEKSIFLITPYFAPRRWFILLLDQARLRGVKVEILLPKNTDLFLVDRVNYFYMKKLSSLGIRIYITSKMNHAKVMIIDKKEGLVGSQNLDILSFDFNSEIGIFFKEPNEVEKICKIAEEWKKDATLFNHNTYKPKWFDYILSPIFRIFAKIF